MLQFVSFIISLAITLILVGIGATYGFSFQVYAGMLMAGAKFIIEFIRLILHP
ncbi:MAG: hypothetical protein ACM3SR_15540 [Ignavibacteriales bacterium]